MKDRRLKSIEKELNGWPEIAISQVKMWDNVIEKMSPIYLANQLSVCVCVCVFAEKIILNERGLRSDYSLYNLLES